MSDDETPSFRGSPCHGAPMMDEDIYLSTKTGRKVIGHMAICLAPARRDGSKSLCFKPCKEVVAHKGGKGLPAAWPSMIESHPQPPWYFVKGPDGFLHPETVLKKNTIPLRDRTEIESVEFEQEAFE